MAGLHPSAGGPRDLKSTALIVGLLVAGGYLSYRFFQWAAARNVVPTHRLLALAGVSALVLVFMMSKFRWSRGWQFAGALALSFAIPLTYDLVWQGATAPLPVILIGSVFANVVMFITAAVVWDTLRREDLSLAVAAGIAFCAVAFKQPALRVPFVLTIIAVAILSRPARL